MNAGTHRGHRAVRQFMESYDESFENFQVVPEEFFEAGDQVVAFVRQSGRGRESGVEIETTPVPPLDSARREGATAGGIPGPRKKQAVLKAVDCESLDRHGNTRSRRLSSSSGCLHRRVRARSCAEGLADAGLNRLLPTVAHCANSGYAGSCQFQLLLPRYGLASSPRGKANQGALHEAASRRLRLRIGFPTLGLFGVVLALALAPVAAAERPIWAANNAGPGAGDNCGGVAFKGSPNSDSSNSSPGKGRARLQRLTQYAAAQNPVTQKPAHRAGFGSTADGDSKSFRLRVVVLDLRRRSEMSCGSRPLSTA